MTVRSNKLSAGATKLAREFQWEQRCYTRFYYRPGIARKRKTISSSAQMLPIAAIAGSPPLPPLLKPPAPKANRSEERRVGKECRCRGWPEHAKQRTYDQG